MRFILVAVYLCCWTLTSHANTILILGDSISAAYGIDKAQGWVALLEEKLEGQCPQADVKNASVSGETTAGGLQRLPALLQEHRPALVVIELGGNDGLRGLSAQAMEQNLTRMISMSREHGAQAVLLGIQMPANYGAAYRKMFADAFQRVAEREQVPFVSLFLDGVFDREAWMQRDGIHPTAAAQPRLLENAWPVLLPGLRSLCPDPAS